MPFKIRLTDRTKGNSFHHLIILTMLELLFTFCRKLGDLQRWTLWRYGKVSTTSRPELETQRLDSKMLGRCQIPTTRTDVVKCTSLGAKRDARRAGPVTAMCPTRCAAHGRNKKHQNTSALPSGQVSIVSLKLSPSSRTIAAVPLDSPWICGEPKIGADEVTPGVSKKGTTNTSGSRWPNQTPSLGQDMPARLQG